MRLRVFNTSAFNTRFNGIKLLQLRWKHLREEYDGVGAFVLLEKLFQVLYITPVVSKRTRVREIIFSPLVVHTSRIFGLPCLPSVPRMTPQWVAFRASATAELRLCIIALWSYSSKENTLL